MSALVLTTIVSVLLGLTLPALIPRYYTQLVSNFLFIVFGVKLLYEAYNMTPDDDDDELREVEEELLKKDLIQEDDLDPLAQEESGRVPTSRAQNRLASKFIVCVS